MRPPFPLNVGCAPRQEDLARGNQYKIGEDHHQNKTRIIWVLNFTCFVLTYNQTGPLALHHNPLTNLLKAVCDVGRCVYDVRPLTSHRHIQEGRGPTQFPSIANADADACLEIGLYQGMEKDQPVFFTLSLSIDHL